MKTLGELMGPEGGPAGPSGARMVVVVVALVVVIVNGSRSCSYIRQHSCKSAELDPPTWGTTTTELRKQSSSQLMH